MWVWMKLGGNPHKSLERSTWFRNTTRRSCLAVAASLRGRRKLLATQSHRMHSTKNAGNGSFSSMSEWDQWQRPTCCQCQIPKTSNIFDYFVTRHSCRGDTKTSTIPIQTAALECSLSLPFFHSFSVSRPVRHVRALFFARIQCRRHTMRAIRKRLRNRLCKILSSRKMKWTVFYAKKKAFFHGHFYKINDFNSF